MIKIDLHSHSVASNDGGITVQDYIRVIEKNILSIVAITDHNNIDLAVRLHEKYPNNIIVGEEIMTREGEIIGLYLTKKIESGLSLGQTITEIKKQSGLCYVPHPIEKLRKGLSWDNLNRFKNDIDILEIGNGRAVNKRNYSKLVDWAITNEIYTAASSDAHGKKGLGKTYTLISKIPNNPETLLKYLNSSKLVIKYPSLIEIFYPKYNRMVNKHD